MHTHPPFFIGHDTQHKKPRRLTVALRLNPAHDVRYSDERRCCCSQESKAEVPIFLRHRPGRAPGARKHRRPGELAAADGSEAAGLPGVANRTDQG